MLVLAGSIIWTRLDHGDETPVATVKDNRKNQDNQNVQPVTRPTQAETNATAQAELARQQAEAARQQAEIARNTELAIARANALEESRRLAAERQRREMLALQAQNQNRRDNKPPPQTNNSNSETSQTGFVLIKSAPPFAALTINGKPQGETPMNAYLEVPVGKCHVEIVHRLSPPFDTIINVTSRISPGIQVQAGSVDPVPRPPGRAPGPTTGKYPGIFPLLRYF